MRRVDCYFSTSQQDPHYKVYCKTKEDALLIKHNFEVENGREGCKAKIFKLKEYDKKLLHCKIYIYKKDVVVAKVYVEKPYECFSLKTHWLLVKDRKIKFSYMAESHDEFIIQEFDKVGQGDFLPLGKINEKAAEEWIKNKKKEKK